MPLRLVLILALGRVCGRLRPARRLAAAARRACLGRGVAALREAGAARARLRPRSPSLTGGPVHHFAHRNGELHAEDVPVADIAATVGTPFYCYSTATLTRHYRVFDEAFADVPHMIAYSCKANSNQAVIATLARLGAGADVVSEGSCGGRSPPACRPSASSSPASESWRANSPSRFEPASIASTSSLSRSLRHCPASRPRPGARLRCRCASIRTWTPARTKRSPPAAGRPSSASRSSRARRTYTKPPASPASGLWAWTCTSAATDLAPFDNAFRLISELVLLLREDGHAIEHVDLGGGLGIPYRDDVAAPPLPAAYADTVKKHMNALGCAVIFEPGRLIAGNAGILVTASST